MTTRITANGTEYEYVDKKLQYRYLLYAGQPEAFWSDWKDVPSVTTEETVEVS